MVEKMAAGMVGRMAGVLVESRAATLVNEWAEN